MVIQRRLGGDEAFIAMHIHAFMIFGQICPWLDKNRSVIGKVSIWLLFQIEMQQQQPEYIAWDLGSNDIKEEVLYSWAGPLQPWTNRINNRLTALQYGTIMHVWDGPWRSLWPFSGKYLHLGGMYDFIDVLLHMSLSYHRKQLLTNGR